MLERPMASKNILVRRVEKQAEKIQIMAIIKSKKKKLSRHIKNV